MPIFLCQKFAAICRQILTFCSAKFLTHDAAEYLHILVCKYKYNLITAVVSETAFILNTIYTDTVEQLLVVFNEAVS